MKLKPETVVKYFGLWPPFLAAGISVKDFDLDKGYVVSQMKISPWNANAFGTMYGGSLYSMCDPFYVFILAHKLGRDYYIWDIESNIKFLKATKQPVSARFEVTEDQIEEIKRVAITGEKVTPLFETTIQDSSGKVVATVKKTLYVKAKPSKK